MLKKKTSGTCSPLLHVLPIRTPPRIEQKSNGFFSYVIFSKVMFSNAERFIFGMWVVVHVDVKRLVAFDVRSLLFTTTQIQSSEKELPDPKRTGEWCSISISFLKACTMKMRAIRKANDSSVNLVMYRTRALRSKATTRRMKNVVHSPIHTLQGRKSQCWLLKWNNVVKIETCYFNEVS